MKKLAVLIGLIALLTLTGSECVFVFESGTNRDEDDEETKVVVTGLSEGRFVDAPVQGLGYASGSVRGITGPNGELLYEAGQPVRFFIGDIMLGEAAEGAPVLSPVDLVPDGDIDTPAVINIARLLQSLDSVLGDDAITLPETLHGVAQRSNATLFASIQGLDFHDDAAFVNAASQIVADLTASYPYTGTLVDSETARQHLMTSLAAAETTRTLEPSVR